MFFSKKWLLTNNEGQEIGALWLEHLWGAVYGIRLRNSVTPTPALEWSSLFSNALAQANVLRATQVLFRLVKEEAPSGLSQRLPDWGFQKKQDRIEYRASLSLLSGDEGSPLVWQSAKSLGWQAKEVAYTLSRIWTGDPGRDPSEDPEAFVQDFLDDAVLTAGLSCIHIGFIHDEIAAMAVVQINPKSGWSRISYMGVVEEFRGRGLGTWVHRFGFSQMRREGGQLYHGGTSVDNAPMLKLFEKHGCQLFCHMEEWIHSCAGGSR